MNLAAYRAAAQLLVEHAAAWTYNPPAGELEDACAQLHGMLHLIVEHKAELARNEPGAT